MAITSGASPGVVVTTAAVNETIPAQTNVSDANTQVEVSDDITTLSNGNLMASPVYTDRLIILRQGLSNEETRYISGANASGVGNTWILDVSEPWVSNPVGSTDTIHVSYIIQDAATLTGLGLVNKTVQDYNSTRRFTVGSGGGTFAFMAFINGVSLQSNDNSSTTVADITVENGGRFDCGYLQEGTPTSGAKIQFAPQVDGELGIEVISGGEFNVYASYIDSVKRILVDFNTSTTSKIRMNGVRWSFAINDILWGVQDTDLNNVAFLSDGGGTTPRIDVRDWTTGNEVKNIICNSFNGFESNTAGDDPVLKNIQFIRMSKILTVATTETWTIVNPIWNPATGTQADISIAGTGEVLEKFSVIITVSDPAGTALVSKVYVITDNNRGGATNSTLFDDVADGTGLSPANGEIKFEVETRRFTDNAGTSLTVETTNGHALYVTEYGKLPIIRSVTLQNADPVSENKEFGISEAFAMLPDDFQVEATAGTAITTGEAKVRWESQTNPASIIKYTGGTGTLNVGNTVTGATSGADGVVLQILEGDSVAGTILLGTRDAVNFSGTETLNESGASSDWSATLTSGSQIDFDYLIDCNDNATTGITIQQLYDYMNAKADQATIVTTTYDMREVMYWANGETNPLPLVGVSLGTPNTFKTIRNVTDTSGVAIYNYTGGNGSIDRFTGNDGSTWIPAATVNLKVTVVEGDFTTVNPGARVGIHRQSDNSEILNAVTDVNGEVSGSFAYTSDVPVFIRVRDEAFDYQKVPATITSSGLDVTIPAADDPVYA